MILFYLLLSSVFAEYDFQLSFIEDDELECASCRRTFSIISGDSISDPEADPLKIYNITEEDGNLFLNL